MATDVKKLSRILIIVIIGFGLISCDRATPRNTHENLPLSQDNNKNKVPQNSVNPTRTPVKINYNKTGPGPENTETNNLPSSATSPSELLNTEKTDPNNELLVIRKLKIPVVGIRPQDLRDTFKDSRSEGRVHDAIDIMAPEDTPVIAAADGEIARFFDSERGGITVYQFSSDRKLVFYYAHLKRRSDNLRENTPVKQGDVIGYVGDTGNSGTGNFHLHFAIWYVTDPKRYWKGTNINPYPLLVN